MRNSTVEICTESTGVQKMEGGLPLTTKERGRSHGKPQRTEVLKMNF